MWIRRHLRLLTGLGAVLVTVLLLGVGAAVLLGVRWYEVVSPSMGRAAPVGTLVIDVPARGGVRAGDIISFSPGGVTTVYTHRVASVTPEGGIRTKGDANSAPDGWLLSPSDVIGRAVAVLPGLGYVLRMLPWLCVGWFVTRLLVGRIHARPLRRALGILGATVTAIVVVAYVHPLINGQLAGLSAGDRTRVATVVNTGMLPAVVSGAPGRPELHLEPGDFGRIELAPQSGGVYGASLSPDVGTWQFWAVMLLSLVPLACSFRPLPPTAVPADTGSEAAS